MQQRGIRRTLSPDSPICLKKLDSPTYFVPPMITREIAAGQQLQIGDIAIDVLHQDHGNSSSLGFLFNGCFGYSTDVVAMPDHVFDALANVDLWIVEALRETPHQSHSHFQQTFEWIERVKPL